MIEHLRFNAKLLIDYEYIFIIFFIGIGNFQQKHNNVSMLEEKDFMLISKIVIKTFRLV